MDGYEHILKQKKSWEKDTEEGEAAEVEKVEQKSKKSVDPGRLELMFDGSDESTAVHPMDFETSHYMLEKVDEKCFKTINFEAKIVEIASTLLIFNFL